MLSFLLRYQTLKGQSLHTSKRGSQSKIELDSSSHGIGLLLVERNWIARGLDNMGSLNVAESGPKDFHARIRLQGDIADLCADMLAFAIAIRPYEKDVGTSCLLFDVGGDCLFVLLLVSPCLHKFTAQGLRRR
jgi:hypothetical protein